MKTLFGVLLSIFAAQANAQSIESDLDGNASALQASEMRPQPQASRPQRQRVASR